MKKAVRMSLTGNLQSLFFKQFIKENATINNVRGFLRHLEDGKVEVFVEGNADDVDQMITVCKEGPKYANIRNFDIKDEKLQDFKDFKILNF